MKNGYTGTIYIIGSVSGAGKTTIIKELRRAEPELFIPIAHTTRQPRENEVHVLIIFLFLMKNFNR